MIEGTHTEKTKPAPTFGWSPVPVLQENPLLEGKLMLANLEYANACYSLNISLNIALPK